MSRRRVMVRLVATEESLEALTEEWLADRPVTFTLEDGRTSKFKLTYVKDQGEAE